MGISWRSAAAEVVEDLLVIANADFGGSVHAAISAALLNYIHLHIDAGKKIPVGPDGGKTSEEIIGAALTAFVFIWREDRAGYEENLQYLREAVLGGTSGAE